MPDVAPAGAFSTAAITVDPVSVVVRAADFPDNATNRIAASSSGYYDTIRTVRLLALAGLGTDGEDGDGCSIRGPKATARIASTENR